MRISYYCWSYPPSFMKLWFIVLENYSGQEFPHWKLQKAITPRKIAENTRADNMRISYHCWSFPPSFMKLWFIVLENYSGQEFPHWKLQRAITPRKIAENTRVNNMHISYHCWSFPPSFMKLWFIVLENYSGQEFPHWKLQRAITPRKIAENTRADNMRISYHCWSFPPSFMKLWFIVLENYSGQEFPHWKLQRAITPWKIAENTRADNMRISYHCWSFPPSFMKLCFIVLENYSGQESGRDGRTDGRTDGNGLGNSNTISPSFFERRGIIYLTISGKNHQILDLPK